MEDSFTRSVKIEHFGGKEESINTSPYFFVIHKTRSRQVPFTIGVGGGWRGGTKNTSCGKK